MDSYEGKPRKVKVPTKSGTRPTLTEASLERRTADAASAETGTGGDLLLPGVEPLVPHPIWSATTSGTGTPEPGGGGAVLMDLLATTAGSTMGGEEELAVFRRSSRLQRTPPKIKTRQEAVTPKEVVQPSLVSPNPNPSLNPIPIPSQPPSQPPSQSGLTRRAPTPTGIEGEGSSRPRENGTEDRQGEKHAPYKRAHIIRLQEEEEEQLIKCRQIIAKMKEATNRQRNISNDVKLGLLELEEAFAAISDCRSKWKKAEEEERAASEKETEAAPAEKRPASSPAGQNEEKRKREDDAFAERVVTSKRTKRQIKAARKKEAAVQPTSLKTAVVAQTEPAASKKKSGRKKTKPRLEAILIRPGDGRSYADVLREIKEKVDPEKSGTQVKAIRQTRSGDVLLEIGGESKDKGAFRDAIKGVLGGRAAVSCLEPKRTLVIRDLDCLIDEPEVKAALKREVPTIGEVKVGLIPMSSGGQRMAIAEMGQREAAILLGRGKIRVGWVYCRVRERASVTRCYRCLGFGHVARECKGPDRSSLFYKCGAAGHKAKTCGVEARCVICAEKGLSKEELGHKPGSGKCRVFREELDRARRTVR